MSYLIRIAIFVVATSSVVAPVASAQEPYHPSLGGDKIEVRFGIFKLTTEAVVSSTRSGRPTFELDLGSLGMDEDVEVPFVSAKFPLGSHWDVNLEYFFYDETGLRQAQVDFEYDDLMVTAGARVESDLDIKLLIANFGYLWRTSDRGEVRVGLGIHMAELGVGLQATVFAGGMQVSQESTDEDLLAPLPNIYLGGKYALSPKWLVRGRLGWLSLSYEDWDGDLFAIGAQLEYSVSKRFVIGVGYTNEDLDVTHEDSFGREKYELDMKGPTLFLGTRF